MKTICELKEGTRLSSIKEIGSQFIVFNKVGEQSSITCPSKVYKTFKGATKYANKFLLK